MTANQNGSFAGKVAFVTGAANGIGRAARDHASDIPLSTMEIFDSLICRSVRLRTCDEIACFH